MISINCSWGVWTTCKLFKEIPQRSYGVAESLSFIRWELALACGYLMSLFSWVFSSSSVCSIGCGNFIPVWLGTCQWEGNQEPRGDSQQRGNTFKFLRWVMGRVGWNGKWEHNQVLWSWSSSGSWQSSSRRWMYAKIIQVTIVGEAKLTVESTWQRVGMN